MSRQGFLVIILLVAHSYTTACIAPQSCVAGESFQAECACIPDIAFMFEGWFGKRTSAYCSQQFPEVSAQ